MQYIGHKMVHTDTEMQEPGKTYLSLTKYRMTNHLRDVTECRALVTINREVPLSTIQLCTAMGGGHKNFVKHEICASQQFVLL